MGELARGMYDYGHTQLLAKIRITMSVEIVVESCPVACYVLNRQGFSVIGQVAVMNEYGITGAAGELGELAELTPEEIEANTYHNLKLTISSMHGIVDSTSYTLDSLAPREVSQLMPNVLIAPQKLRALAEVDEDEIIVTLTADGKVVSEKRYPLLVLTSDYWPWTVYPESVACWVNPNEPLIRPIRNKVIENLRALTGNGSLDEYQSGDKNRILAMATAAFDAIKSQRLTYSSLVPSPGGLGQRLRPPGNVLAEGVGNCIDLAVLYCSVLEAMGLNSFVVMIEGHAFAGLWLEERTFSEIAVSSPSALVNRLEKGIEQIALVECTTLSQDSSANFKEATQAAALQILEEGRFNLCIDIRRARNGGMRPLFTGQHGEIVEVGRESSEMEENELEVRSAAPTTSGAHSEYIDSTDLTPRSRIEVWEKGLLDLTMRNALLNMRLGRSLLAFATLDIDSMEDLLAQSQKLSIGPKPAEFATPDNSFEIARALSQYTDLFATELKQKRIRALLTSQMLDATLKDLSRKAHLSITETGVNTLYLSLGALRWFRPGDPQPRYAPILLVPVELSRKSAASGYTIEIRDEEVVLNITLLEHLRRNFGIHIGGLQPLPQDDHGVDTRKVFNTFRNRILDMPGWELFEVACLGIFKFSNFVLWDDIHRHADKLAKSPVVNSLINGHLTWTPEPLELPERVTAEDAVIAIEADASQLYAIKAANAGHSFVLHGPPGTGKSQVITGIIANALAHGKRVLFVAEKAAALNVVENRLNKLGIGAHCLSIHSHQTNKTHILQQLQAAIDQSRQKNVPSTFASQRATVERLKNDLDAYSDALNAVNKVGLTTREQISRYLALGSSKSIEELTAAAPHPQFLPDSYLERLTSMDMLESDLRILNVLVAETISMLRRGRPVAGNPLACLGTKVTSTAYQAVSEQGFSKNLARVAAASSILAKTIQLSAATSQWATLSLEVPSTLGAVREVSTALKACVGEQALPLRWYLEPNLGAVVSDCERLLAEVHNHRQFIMETSSQWKPSFFGLDLAAVKSQWEDAQKFRLFGSGGAKRKVADQFRDHALVDFTVEGIPQALAVLEVFQRRAALIDELIARLDALLEGAKPVYGGGYSSAFNVDPVAELDVTRGLDVEKIRQWIDYVAARPAELTDETVHSRVVAVARAKAQGDSTFMASLSDLAEKSDEWIEAVDQLRANLNQLGSGEEIIGDSATIDEINAFVSEIETHRTELSDWVRWCDVAQPLHKIGLSVAVTALAEGADPDLIVNAVTKSLFERMIRQSMASHDALARFSSAEMAELIRQYRAADTKLRAVARTYVRVTLAERAAALDTSTKKYAQLTKAINSRGRNLNMRQLLSESADVVGALTPVMLMSPLSVAQYVDLDAEPFDLVIFDEASQLQTCKAVGALARGRSAVIVGDPKQMPPTSFFSTKEAEEELTDMSDLESILDDCLAINMPQTYLEWHYRSKHESLISFSNEQFYDSKLCTFPSSREDQSQVRYVHVPGHYSGDGINEFEARAVVRELRRRYLVNPSAETCSTGIITFNVKQQTLIEDLLEQEFLKDPRFDQWSRAGSEPLFVKNLENVQGDERDTILFSITYAPDEDGRMAMRFGPINTQGGERRLNVAFTRSREEMMIFSTLQPDEIDLRRSSARGVRVLKNFLSYAKSGQFASATLTTSDTADGIADGIAAALEARGYQCDRNVGSSSMRIDIAVKAPAAAPDDVASGYIAGILLDGPSYRAARSTRDRELAHSNVLTNLGWNVLRVWALEWWHDPEFVIDSLVQQIDEYIEAGRAAALASREESERQSAVLEALAGVEEAVVDEVPISEESIEEDDQAEQISETVTPAEDVIADDEPVEEAPELVAADENGRASEVSQTIEVVKYTEINLPTDVALTADEYNSSNDELIIDRIRLLIDAEAPIERGLLIRRVRESFGLARSGTNVQKRTEDLIKRARVTQLRRNGQIYLWRRDQDHKSYAVVRTTSSGQSRHNIEAVAPEEIIAAFVGVFADQPGDQSMSTDDLYLKASRLLGFGRRSSRMTVCFDYALGQATRRSILKKDGRNVVLGTGIHGDEKAAAVPAAPAAVTPVVNTALTPLRSRLAEPLDLGEDCPGQLLFIDFETPNEAGDRACAVGYVVTDLSGGVIDEQHFLINPECEFSQRCIAVHGIRSRDVATAPTFVDIWNRYLRDLVRSSWLVAHNATFDMAVLYRNLAAYGLDNLDVTAACTLKICRAVLKNVERFGLPMCAQHLGVEMEGQHHNALADARTCAEIFFALAGRDHVEPSNFIVWPKPVVLAVGSTDAPAAPSRPVNEANAALQRLFAHLEHIIADGVVTPVEALEVRNLLRVDELLDHRELITPLNALVDEIFADGIVELHEADKLYHEIVRLLNPVTDDVAEEIANGLQGKTCVITGEFAYGPRAEVEAYIRDLGGTVVSSVSGKVDYVIMGSLKSDAWKFANYGTKVKRALELREKGFPILIIQEEQLFSM